MMSEKFDYINTFYHQEPFLDICSLKSATNYQNMDFIICSDVLEHTQSTPVEVLSNLMMMLRPGGHLFLTVPTVHMPVTVEWYSGALEAPKSVQLPNGTWNVLWKNRRGCEYIDTQPSFHGGPGDTLEMRMISHEQIIREAEGLGFAVHTLEFDPERGYYWPLYQAHESFERTDGRVLVMRRKC